MHVLRHTFAQLDQDQDGVLSVSDMVHGLKDKISGGELRHAVFQALQEAGEVSGDNKIDFNGFINLVRVRSADSLTLYDDRYRSPCNSARSSFSLASVLEGSLHHDSLSCDDTVKDASHSKRSLYRSDGEFSPTPKLNISPSVSRPFRFDIVTADCNGAKNLGDGSKSTKETSAEARSSDPDPFNTEDAQRDGSSYVGAAAGRGMIDPLRVDGVRGGMRFDMRMHGANHFGTAYFASDKSWGKLQMVQE